MKNTGTCTAIRRNRILSFIPFRSREYQEWPDKTIEDLDEYAENIFCNAVNLAMQGCWKKEHEEREQGSVFSVSETELHRAADPLWPNWRGHTQNSRNQYNSLQSTATATKASTGSSREKPCVYPETVRFRIPSYCIQETSINSSILSAVPAGDMLLDIRTNFI